MTWRRAEPHARKAFWDGPGWPPEVSPQTRVRARAAGWDEAGWASCRNAAYEPVLERWFDRLPLFHTPVPAGVVAEMVDRAENPEAGLRMLDALAVGVPPCMAWLFAHDTTRAGEADWYWDAAGQLGLTPMEMVGWWHAGLFTDYAFRARPALDVPGLQARIHPWAKACGPNAFLWAMAGYKPLAAKRSILAGKTTEAQLRAKFTDEGFALPTGLNDHCAPELEHTEYEKGNWDQGWVTPANGWYPVWTEQGWPAALPGQTRVAALDAGWTNQDWAALHGECKESSMREWLWNMPTLSEPVDPQGVRDLIAAHGEDLCAGILTLASEGVPVLFSSVAGLRLAQQPSGLEVKDQISYIWALAHALGMTEGEATGWALTGYLDVPSRKWGQEDTVEKVMKRVAPWRDRFGPSAFLWVLAGVGRREAARTVKQPGWDDRSLRVMVALNGVNLPAGV